MLASRNLPEASDAGAHLAPLLAQLGIGIEHVQHERARTDQAHLAHDHVKQLRQLVNAGLAQEAANASNARIILRLEQNALRLQLLQLGNVDQVLLLQVHGAELPAHEVSSPAPPTLLPEEGRSPRR